MGGVVFLHSNMLQVVRSEKSWWEGGGILACRDLFEPHDTQI